MNISGQNYLNRLSPFPRMLWFHVKLLRINIEKISRLFILPSHSCYCCFILQEKHESLHDCWIRFLEVLQFLIGDAVLFTAPRIKSMTHDSRFFFFETGFCSRNLRKMLDTCHPATLGRGQRRLTPPEIKPSLFQTLMYCQSEHGALSLTSK